LFSAVTGQRPAAFYRTLRLRYARWLLDHTDRSITDVALEAGFADCAHFSRQFKAAHGLTPSSVRRGAGSSRSARTPATLAVQRLFD
jgi:transcriptional regulator GlxA family with amidase domain